MKKILFVDDDHDMLDVVKFILIENGFQVKTNSNGYNLSEIVKDYNPDIILFRCAITGQTGTRDM